MEKIHCIYGIKDLRNNKVIYIGQTKDFNKRKKEHFRKKSSYVDKYMFEQGRENFEMYILKKLSDDISKDEILKLEDNYIKKFNTIESGLNKCRSGNISKDNKYFREYSREYKKSEKYRKWLRDYKKSEKYKEYLRKKYEKEKEFRREYYKEYYKSEKRKEYYKSEKWKEYMRDYQREYMRQYRLKKKLEKQNEVSIKRTSLSK